MRVVVMKGRKSLSLIGNDENIVATFKIALGPNPQGPKTMKGDGKTPEGHYTVLEKRDEGETSFYRGFYLSYPNNQDSERARRLGVNPGGDILIHGLKNGLGYLGGLHRWRNWTNGCIAVTNEEMDDLWPHVEVGTSVEIRP